MLLRATVVAAVLLAAAATSVVRAQDAPGDTAYDIRLTRPVPTGQRLSFQGECMISQRTSGVLQGMPIEGDTIEHVLRLASEVEVHEVDEHGRPTSVTHTVKSCTISMDGTPVARLEAGKTIRVVCNGPQSDVQVQSMSLNGPMQSLFKLLVSLDGDGVTEDEMFGSEQPRRVNETWPLHTEAALAEMQRQTAHPMTAEQLSGGSRLLGLVTYDGRRCLKIHTTLETDGIIPGLEGLPPDATLEEASMQARFEGLYPEDGAVPWVARSGQMDMTLVMRQPNLGTLRSQTRMVVNVSRSLLGGDPMTTSAGGDDR